MTTKEMKKEVRGVFADMTPEMRSAVLGDLLTVYCPCCGDKAREDGECCDA